MPTPGGAAIVSDHSSKPKKPKSREVSSRFLSPTSPKDHQHANQSPKTNFSPVKQTPRSSTDSRNHRSLENSGFLSGLWPASSSSNALPPSKSKPDTLADHLGNDRLKDMHEEERGNRSAKPHQKYSSILGRQRSCTEFSRFEDDKMVGASAKENHKPTLGGSVRYTGKFKFHRRSSHSSSKTRGDPGGDIAPGRFSVDENALRKRSSFSGRGLSDSDTQDSESEYSDVCSGETPAAGKISPASYMAPTFSSRKQGIGVPSRLMHSLSSRRWSSVSDNSGSINYHSNKSDNTNNNNSQNLLSSKKSNGKWSLSPGRSNSKITGSTNSKPPSSPSRGKGVGNFLSIGIELLKGKRHSSSSASSPVVGSGLAENVHQLRLLHNGLMQWRYCNARTEAANGKALNHVEGNLVGVWNSLVTLRRSVLQKKLQLQKEKLEMKLNYILQSQIKWLEIWENMERQHIASVSATKDYLHSVVCRIPLVEGAKVDPKSASLVVRRATDLAASINMTLTSFSPEMERAVRVMGEVAMVVTQERLLLEDCFELFRNIIAMEVQERSLQSSIMQLKLLQQQQSILAK